jgi:citrate lyase subunit beta/citryl-CoA lyase
MEYSAGYRGGGIRSDCFVQFVPDGASGIHIEVKSKVMALYGESIRSLGAEVLDFYGIKHGRLLIEDSGALPFTLAARLEACIQSYRKNGRAFLLPALSEGSSFTPRDMERTTRLYLPGNQPKLMINAGIYQSEGIILDLEDSVAPDRKAEARILVRNALRAIDFFESERMVRINSLPKGLDDLPFCLPHGAHTILIPKCEQPDEIRQVDKRIAEIMGSADHGIHLIPIIETAAGLLRAFELACASPQIVSLAIGLEDYTSDIGAQRTIDGKEAFYARNMIVNAARAAGIQPIDSVFSDVDDLDALARSVIESKSLGFEGMGCIHPRQIGVIKEHFLPTAAERNRAMKVVLAFEEAERVGSAVIAVDSKMIDLPVVNRARRTVEKAVRAKQIPENWRENHE